MSQLTGPCEFSRGEVRFDSHKPTVVMCGKPGVVRKGVMWCDVVACDECYGNWLNRARDE